MENPKERQELALLIAMIRKWSSIEKQQFLNQRIKVTDKLAHKSNVMVV